MLGMESAEIAYDNFKLRSDAENAVAFSKSYPSVVEYCFAIDKIRD